jgi:hypothetical protein
VIQEADKSDMTVANSNAAHTGNAGIGLLARIAAIGAEPTDDEELRLRKALLVASAVGFVNMRKDGNRRLYRADKKALGPLAAVLQSMWSTSLDSLVEMVEADQAKRRPR